MSFLRNRIGTDLGLQYPVIGSPFSYYSPHFRLIFLWAAFLFLLVTLSTFLHVKLSRGTIIAANIGQALVNLKLWLSTRSSSYRQLHGGRGSNSQSVACQPHTLPLEYHVRITSTEVADSLFDSCSALLRWDSQWRPSTVDVSTPFWRPLKDLFFRYFVDSTMARLGNREVIGKVRVAKKGKGRGPTVVPRVQSHTQIRVSALNDIGSATRIDPGLCGSLSFRHCFCIFWSLETYWMLTDTDYQWDFRLSWGFFVLFLKYSWYFVSKK